MVTLSASEARATLPEVLDRVEAGEEVVVTRHGKQVAVIVRPDTLRVRRAGPALDAAAAVRDRLKTARRSPLPKKGLSPRRANTLVKEVRAGRDAR